MKLEFVGHNTGRQIIKGTKKTIELQVTIKVLCAEWIYWYNYWSNRSLLSQYIYM